MSREEISPGLKFERDGNRSLVCNKRTEAAHDPGLISQTMTTRGEFSIFHLTPNGIRDEIIPHSRNVTNNHNWQRLESSFDHGALMDERFLDASHKELIAAYKHQCEVARTAVEDLCADLVRQSVIPPLEEPEAPLTPSESAEDAHQRSKILQEFGRAIERLQTGNVPVKRRENLPKECISYLKTWCQEHYDNPCMYRFS
ncbi:hypothetical protein FGB62_121g07 [Gracilaria domingensis]|nr:hypothetical protein FGB62_121g07 [Gracilaria domingensis]